MVLMLSIGKLSGPDSERYYTVSVAKGREDYYAGHGEAPGRWIGNTTDLLLETDNEVSGKALGALLRGQSPASNEPLGRGAAARSVNGFDLTFSAPKSVSVLYGVGDEVVSAATRQAHEQAVDQAVRYLEENACWTRRGLGGRKVVQGDGFVGAAFRHRSSRAGDPALHTHVVVANITHADGKWSALDGRHLYRHVKTAGYLYQAALRAELTEQLGVEWEATQNGMADIRGVPRRVIDHFSRRRFEILEQMADRGERSRRAASIAALETRKRKDYSVPVDALRADWCARAAEQGFGQVELLEVLHRHDRLPDPLDIVSPSRSAGVELTRESSSFDRRDVLRVFAEMQRDGAPVADVERLADEWLESGRAVQLEQGRGPWQPRHSTPEMLRAEKDLLATGQARRREGVARVDDSIVEASLAQRPQLAREQVEMVRTLMRSGNGVEIVRAAAGTGKTYALDAAREAWEQSGCTVRGCALSARAAIELQDQSGIPSTTIAALQLDLRHADVLLTPRTVLVVDEAGTVGTRDLAELSRHAHESGAKLVLCGDDRQLPEIEAGGGFRGLAKRLGAIELRDVKRQQHEWDRDALHALRDGKVERWADAYREHDRIHGAHNAEAARAQLVADWHEAVRSRPEADNVMIASRRVDVAELNQRARGWLRAANELGPTELEIGERAFSENDRVIACHNDRRAGVSNGMRGTVAGVDLERRSLTVTFDGGHKRELGASYLEEGHLDHGYALTAHRAQGSTVDAAFVLGADDLYREWGYTALSRHRTEAHYYVTLGEPQLSFEPTVDLDDELAHQLRRSRTKQLALDLHDRSRATVELADDGLPMPDLSTEPEPLGPDGLPLPQLPTATPDIDFESIELGP